MGSEMCIRDGSSERWCVGVVAFPCKIGAPVTGITLSTRVGRLSRTHFDTGFPLNSISPMGRKVMELHGGESERLVGVSTSCWSSLLNDRSARLSCKTNAAKGRFWGSIMNHHENKKGDWTACAKVVAGTHQSVLWCFPCHIPASLGQVECDRPGPPAFGKMESGHSGSGKVKR